MVGESGSGKSTTASTLMRLQEPTSGRIVFDGADVTHCRGVALRAFRRHAQLILQDPYQSINPRFTVLQAVAEPLVIHGLARRDELRDRLWQALGQVGLKGRGCAARSATGRVERWPAPTCFDRARHDPAAELAGRGRAGFHAGCVDPRRGAQTAEALVAGEWAGCALHLARHRDGSVLCDRVAVMYLGRIVEQGPTADVLGDPQHPYTRALVAAVPRATGPRRVRVRLARNAEWRGSPDGSCLFGPRCPEAFARCATERPGLRPLAPGRSAACHLAGVIDDGAGYAHSSHAGVALGGDDEVF